MPHILIYKEGLSQPEFSFPHQPASEHQASYCRAITPLIQPFIYPSPRAVYIGFLTIKELRVLVLRALV